MSPAEACRSLGWGVLPSCGPHSHLWSPQNITNELLRIEPEKARGTAECEAFVQALPGSGSAPLLRTRVEDTKHRYERLVQLLDLAQEKWVSGRQGGGQAGSRGRRGTPLTPDPCPQDRCCQPTGEEPAAGLGGAGHL